MKSYLNPSAVVISLLFISILAIVLNVLCIYIIRKSKNLNRHPSSILIINLLCVHLLQGVFVFPTYAGKKLGDEVSSYLLAQIFANGYRFTYILSFYGACLGVLSIAFDRVLATYLLNRYKSKVTSRRILIWLACMWGYIIILCVIPFFNHSYRVNREVSNLYDIDRDLPPNSTRDYFEYENRTLDTAPDVQSVRPQLYFYNHQPGWVVFMLIFNAAVPYLLIIISYAYITVRLKKIGDVRQNSHRQEVQFIINGKTVEMKSKSLRRYREVAYLTLGLTITYGVCWTPSIVNYTLESLCESCYPPNYNNSRTEQIVGFIIKYLAYVNSVGSPLIYCFYHSEFRRMLLRLKSSILRKPLPPIEDDQETVFMI